MVVINGYNIISGVNLTRVDLSHQDMHGVDLRGANLTHTNFTNTDLHGADLRGANLTNTIFFMADLRGTKLADTYRGVSILDEVVSFTQDTDFAQKNTKDYYITPTVDYSINAFTTGTLDTYIRIYQLSSQLQPPISNPVTRRFREESYTQITYNDDAGGIRITNASITFQALANVKYVIAFGCYHGNTGSTTLQYRRTIIHNDASNFRRATFRGSDLTNVNLSYANLNGADLNDAALTGTILTGANLFNTKSGNIQGPPASLPTNYKLVHGYIFGPYADFTDANFTGIDLRNQNWFGVKLTHATLTGANLDGALIESAADLTGVRSGGIVGIPGSLPPNYVMRKGYILGPNASLERFNPIRGTRIAADLTDVDLTDVDLTGVNMTNAILTGATLTNAIFTNGHMSHTSGMTGVISGNIVGEPASLPILSSSNVPIYYRIINGYIVGPDVNLTGANLTGADLTGVNLTGADLTNANLTNATLTNATLTSAWMNNANLTNVNLMGVRSSYIRGKPTLPTNYRIINGYIVGPGQDLRRADLGRGPNTLSNFDGVNFYGMDLTGANLSIANLSYANFSFSNLTNAILTAANLTGVISGYITGNPTLPTKYVLRNGYIVGPNVNLTNADLTSEYLIYADRTGVDLTGANLTNVNLARTQMQNAILTGVKGKIYTILGLPALPTNYRIINDYIVGPGVILTGVDLTNANLTGMDLTNANLTGATLTGANLYQVTLTGAILTGADLTGVKSGRIVGIPTLPTIYVMRLGYIVGPNVNLSGAILSGMTLNVNFRSASLAGANLTGAHLFLANLRRANLTGAILTGANLRYANLGSANLQYANLTDAQMHKANLSYAKLSNAKFIRADLSEATLSDVSHQYGNRVDFSYADMRKVEGKDAKLTSCKFIGARFENATFEGAWFTRSDFTDAKMHKVDLTSVRMYNAKFIRADLTEADLTDVRTFETDFTDADLRDADRGERDDTLNWFVRKAFEAAIIVWS